MAVPDEGDRPQSSTKTTAMANAVAILKSGMRQGIA
jgi:hypothetical protein